MDGNRVLLPQSEETAASRLLTLVGIVVVIAGLYFGRQMLMPLALAIVCAFLLTPPVELLERWHLGRVPSTLIVMILSIALLGVVAWGVSNQLLEIATHLPDYKENIHDKIEAIRAPANGKLGKVTATVTDLSKELSDASQNAQKNKLTKNTGKEPIPVQVAAPPRNPTEYLRDIVGPLTGILETATIVIILTLFVLLKREDLRNRLLQFAGNSQLNIATQGLDDASRRLGRYLLLQFAVNAGYGILFGIGLYAIGLPHPLLWGVLGFLLRLVPYIGSTIAAFFPITLGMAVFNGWKQVLFIFALFLVLEIVISNFIEPLLYGAHTGVSSLARMVAAIFWSMIWGPAGLILSTPLTLCLIIMGSYIPQLRFLKVLLGDEPVLSPPAHFYQRLLALDEEEAREIAEKYLKENSLEALFDSLVVPALSLAENDRHINALDENRTRFIYQTSREIIEELSGDALAEAAGQDAVLPAVSAPVYESRIVCVPARDEADEIVGFMVAQLLRRSGRDAQWLPIGPVASMLEQVEQLKAEILCVSALPPFALAQAKSLCKQLRKRFPHAKVVLGLWDFPGGVAKAQERGAFGCADVIGTSLIQTVSLMGEGIVMPTSPALTPSA